MKAEEARILTQQCTLYNDQRNYDYVISKIIQSCSNGTNYIFIDKSEIYNSTMERLISDAYKIEILDAIDIIQIKW